MIIREIMIQEIIIQEIIISEIIIRDIKKGERGGTSAEKARTKQNCGNQVLYFKFFGNTPPPPPMEALYEWCANYA